jgi:hypothetical protein
MRTVRPAILFALLAVLGLQFGCTVRATPELHRQGSRIQDPDVLGPEVPDSRTLTGTEILRSELPTAFDALMQLRPEFLRARTLQPGGQPQSPALFIDRVLFPIETLRSIPAASVAEIRLFDRLEAITRFGPQFSAGVVLVQIRK